MFLPERLTSGVVMAERTPPVPKDDAGGCISTVAGTLVVWLGGNNVVALTLSAATVVVWLGGNNVVALTLLSAATVVVWLGGNNVVALTLLGGGSAAPPNAPQ